MVGIDDTNWDRRGSQIKRATRSRPRFPFSPGFRAGSGLPDALSAIGRFIESGAQEISQDDRMVLLGLPAAVQEHDRTSRGFGHQQFERRRIHLDLVNVSPPELSPGQRAAMVKSLA